MVTDRGYGGQVGLSSVSRFLNVGAIKMTQIKIFNMDERTVENLISQTDVGTLTEFDLFETSLFHLSC